MQLTCSIPQAWAARFSDSPLVLGAEGALTLPTLNDLRTQVGRDFTDIGNRRAPFAEAMVERAMNRFDQVGVLRKASAAGCAALLLLEFLTTWGQVDRPQPSYGRNLMASVAEHLVTMVDPAYVSDDPSEIRVPPERVSGGTLLWMAYTRDALSAVFYGRNPCLCVPSCDGPSPRIRCSLFRLLQIRRRLSLSERSPGWRIPRGHHEFDHVQELAGAVGSRRRLHVPSSERSHSQGRQGYR